MTKSHPLIPDCLIDLHLHLDGSVSVKNARNLASICKVPLPLSDEELEKELKCPENCRDLNDFLTKFDLPLKLLQTNETLTCCTETLCNELLELGLIYAEIRFAPQLHTRGNLNQEDAVKAVLDGINKSSFKAQIILCCMRGDNNKVENAETLELCKKYLGKGVCALDLAGAEALYPNTYFTDLFKEACDQQIPFTIHAGEALGADSVKMAIAMSAKRIGHGVRSIEDKDTLNMLESHKITLECCPTSNLLTKVFNSYRDFPFMTFKEHHIPFTINSDDMAVCGTNVRKEFELLMTNCDFTLSDVKNALLNSVNSAFLQREEKTELSKIISEKFSIT